MTIEVYPPTNYPSPRIGASLVVAFRPRAVLVIGANQLAANRAFAALEAGAKVFVVNRDLEVACEEIRWRLTKGQIEWVTLPIESESVDGLEREVEKLADSLPEVNLVCITDTLVSSNGGMRGRESAEVIAAVFRKRRVPINVTDIPDLCDYTFPATHRFTATTGGSSTPTSLQVAVTTNGKACRLAGRIKREIVATLPGQVGMAIENIGKMRAHRNLESCGELSESMGTTEEAADGTGTSINAPVPQDSGSMAEEPLDSRRRRMRWIAQMSEYWPLERLASLIGEEMEQTLSRYWEYGNAPVRNKGVCTRRRAAASHNESGDKSPSPSVAVAESSVGPTNHSTAEDDQFKESTGSDVNSLHALSTEPVSYLQRPRGRILLIGSGPGHPSLLTIAAHKAITELATLILSDKLVPAAVLALVPNGTTLHIAKKFPGNAEGAQNELMEMAVAAAERGETVVRLKQGDPFLYGRGGEEVLYFRSHGFEPLVIPGISSALAAPLVAGIAVTQRGVAESFVVCTGVGRQGRDMELPGYQRQQSVSILMGVARLVHLVEALTQASDPNGANRRKGEPYPSYLPVAIIERASCSDQRVIFSTISRVVFAMESCGEQRPPAMIFVGWAVMALAGSGDLTVLDDAATLSQDDLKLRDIERVTRWLGAEGILVREGLDDCWNVV